MEIYWTPEAIEDRIEIYEYIEERNPAAALTIDALFSEQAAPCCMTRPYLYGVERVYCQGADVPGATFERWRRQTDSTPIDAHSCLNLFKMGANGCVIGKGATAFSLTMDAIKLRAHSAEHEFPARRKVR